jgi:hypothetical protein
MSRAVVLDVSLPVKIVIGHSWGSMGDCTDYLARQREQHRRGPGTGAMDVDLT